MINLDHKRAKERIGFHHLLTKMQLYTLNKIIDKSITHNICRIQDIKSIMCGFYSYFFHRVYACWKNFLDHTNLFFSNVYKKDDKITYKYFKDKPDRSSSN